jgi:hypothetical protein
MDELLHQVLDEIGSQLTVKVDCKPEGVVAAKDGGSEKQ